MGTSFFASAWTAEKVKVFHAQKKYPKFLDGFLANALGPFQLLPGRKCNRLDRVEACLAEQFDLLGGDTVWLQFLEISEKKKWNLKFVNGRVRHVLHLRLGDGVHDQVGGVRGGYGARRELLLLTILLGHLL